MTLILTASIMIAFAGVYAALVAMVGNHAGKLGQALFAAPTQGLGSTAAASASRRFSRA